MSTTSLLKRESVSLSLIKRESNAGYAAPVMDSQDIDVSVVLPIYRTASALRELYERLCRTLDGAQLRFELLMVDDGSPDGAWAILQELAATDRRVKGIRLSRNFGQHPAIAAGFAHVKGKAVILMDADLQDAPEDLPILLKKLEGDVDVVYTTKRGHERDTLLNRLTSQLYHYTFSRLTGATVPRNIGTFRAFSRRFLHAILNYPERNVLFGPLMFHVGFTSAVVEVTRQPRYEGRSGYTFRKRLTLALNSLLNYTDLPHRFLMTLGGTILAIVGIYTLLLIARYLVARDNLPPGLTLLALLMMFSLGSTMLALGVMGIYLFRVYQEVLGRPRYVIARSLNLPE